jgi:uncharacterized protein YjdB
MIKKHIICFVALIMNVCLFGQTKEVTIINVPSTSIYVNDQVSLDYTNNFTVNSDSWSSSDPSIASVDQYSGVVTAHKAGSVKIIAKVFYEERTPTSTCAELTTCENDYNDCESKCDYELYPDGCGCDISYDCSSITCPDIITYPYIEGECNITIIDKIDVSSVIIDNAPLTALHPKDNYDLTATINPSDATNTDIEWTSSKPSIATIDPSTGELTAISVGTTTITVTTVDGKKTASCIITIQKIAVTGVRLTSYSLALNTYETSPSDFYEIVEPENATDGIVKWSSRDPNIATVDESSGLIKAISAGSTIITVTTNEGSFSANCTVTVSNIDVNAISFGSSLTIVGQRTGTLSPTILPVDATDKSITWASDDINIATVDANGIVTAISAGMAIITATSVSNPNITGDYVVTIKPEITGITVINATGDVYAGDGQLIRISGYGFGGLNGNDGQGAGYVTFTSADNINNTTKLPIPDFDDFDYQHNCPTCGWYNDHIVMLLPGEVTIPNGILNGVAVSESSIGSGAITITPNLGTSYNSSEYNDFTIKHCYMQTIDADGTKYTLRPYFNQFVNNGIVDETIPFKINFPSTMDVSIQHTITQAIQWAMDKWNCSLGTNFYISTPSDPLGYYATSNVITIDVPPGNHNALQETVPPNLFNMYSSNNAWATGIFTIYINPNYTWDYNLPNTTSIVGYDFYAAIAHELGHVLRLEHVNTNNDLMFSTINYNASKDIMQNDIEGANTMLDETQSLNWITRKSQYPICPTLPTSTGFNGSSSNGTVNLSWNEVDPNASITISRTLGSITTLVVSNLSGSVSSYTENNVPSSGTSDWTYILTAHNVYGTEIYTTLIPTAVPTGSSSNNSGGGSLESISVPSIANASYTLLRSSSPNGTYSTVTATLTSTNGITMLNDASVLPGVTYYYKVVTTSGLKTSTSSVISAIGCLNTNGLTTITLSGNAMGSSIGTTITSSGSTIVANGSSLTAEATQNIGFKPGFSAKPGSTMKAFIVPACGSTKSDLVDTTLLTNGKLLQNTKILKSNIDSTQLNIENKKIKIFPNPTKGLISIQIVDENFSYDLYSILGIILKNNNSCNNHTTIDLSNYPTGTYFIRIRTENNDQQVIKILKE